MCSFESYESYLGLDTITSTTTTLIFSLERIERAGADLVCSLPSLFQSLYRSFLLTLAHRSNCFRNVGARFVKSSLSRRPLGEASAIRVTKKLLPPNKSTRPSVDVNSAPLAPLAFSQQTLSPVQGVSYDDGLSIVGWRSSDSRKHMYFVADDGGEKSTPSVNPQAQAGPAFPPSRHLAALFSDGSQPTRLVPGFSCLPRVTGQSRALDSGALTETVSRDEYVSSISVDTPPHHQVTPANGWKISHQRQCQWAVGQPVRG